MVTGDAWEEAVALARAHPTLAVGLHLVLAAGRAVLPPAEIPLLLDRKGHLHSSPTLAGLLLQFHSKARRQARREIRAQLERFRGTGLGLSQVDGHLHLHVHPVVIEALADLARELDIPAVRLPHEEPGLAAELDGGRAGSKPLWSAVFAALRRRAVPRLEAAGVAVADCVYGLHFTGRLDEAYFLSLVPRISSDWTEIYCHPAFPNVSDSESGLGEAGLRELAALVSPRVRAAIDASGLTLTDSREAAAARRVFSATSPKPGTTPPGRARI